MESKIKVMDTSLSNKIAAGEVVEALVNVVKELVENSIDAKSSVIKIDLLDSGTKSISVSDNGVGMNNNDAIKCLERHATSKLYTDDDLFNIHTLGFRGEAIPSIAAVSKMTIETSDEIDGTYIYVEGGDVLENRSSELRKGTKITVEDIFYNVPARLKYMNNIHTELANISFYVGKMALAYPNIKFVLTNNDKVLINTDGSNNLLKVINGLYGTEVAKKMIKIEKETSDYDINGYISKPEVNRSSKGFITLLVNGRYVRNLDVTKAIIDGYESHLMTGRYPVVVLNIDVDPSIVDVNVHPTKMEIKFSKINELKEVLTDSIKKALEKLVLVPEIKEKDAPVINIDKVTTLNTEVDFKEKEVVKPEYEEINFDFNISETETVYNLEKDTLPKIEPLAILKETYIVASSDDGMYLIDQHALHERINYEKIKKEMGKETIEQIDLLVPFKLTFSKDEYIKLKEKEDLIKDFGISYEEFGSNTIIVRSHPLWLNKDYASEIIRKMIEIIISDKEFSKEKFNDKVAATAACRASIKAGDFITLDEASSLLEQIRSCDNPYNCPHGRPVIIKYTYYELEKLFKRVV